MLSDYAIITVLFRKIFIDRKLIRGIVATVHTCRKVTIALALRQYGESWGLIKNEGCHVLTYSATIG
jgi:hypothetical protein